MRLDRFMCPVCGEYAFEKLGDYDICPTCGWENDRTQFLDPDFEGGANEMSLNQAKLAYQYKRGVIRHEEDC